MLWCICMLRVFYGLICSIFLCISTQLRFNSIHFYLHFFMLKNSFHVSVFLLPSLYSLGFFSWCPNWIGYQLDVFITLGRFYGLISPVTTPLLCLLITSFKHFLLTTIQLRSQCCLSKWICCLKTVCVLLEKNVSISAVFFFPDSHTPMCDAYTAVLLPSVSAFPTTGKHKCIFKAEYYSLDSFLLFPTVLERFYFFCFHCFNYHCYYYYFLL